MIHLKSKIGSGNVFGYGSIIGEHVTIGNNNYIGNHASITGNTIIGDNNFIGHGAIIGLVSNHVLRKQKDHAFFIDEKQKILIGNDNLFSDAVTIHAPVVSATAIGNKVNVGTRAHIAHDVLIEDSVVINAHCAFGGYVKILSGSNVGAGVNIHPRIVIGQYSMLGLGSVIIRHIAPGATVIGNPQRYLKPNTIGMQRNNLPTECIEELSHCLQSNQVNLNYLSSQTQEIIRHFFKLLDSNYVRPVHIVPFLSVIK